ncbi:MAG: hypothetical protein ACFFEN_00115 [Candidatus Thorarchaeota archaeon]
MTKKNQNKELEVPQPQNLVIFKSKVEKKQDQFTFETIDQEDKIKLAYDFQPHGGHYLYSLQLINESLAPITAVKIKIDYSKSLTLTRSYPPTIYIPEPIEEAKMIKINVEFDELNEKSSRQINLHFTPTSLGNKGEIKTVITYVTTKDFVRALNTTPIELMLDEITIIPKIIPSTYIQEFSQKQGMKRAIKSIGIGKVEEFDTELYFNLLEQVFIRNHLQLIAKDPAKKILWYFGSELESKEDVLVIGQIISNKIEIIVISTNHHVLISFLTLFTHEFKEHLLIREIVSSPEQIYDLECKYCGAILPYFPNKGEEIACKNCSFEQILW